MSKAIPTGVGKLDELLGGGLRPRVLTQFFGVRSSGKSLLALQAAVSAAKMGLDTVVIDTEQGFIDGLAGYWLDKLSKRFGVEVRLVKGEIVREGCGKKKRTDVIKLKERLFSTLNELGYKVTQHQLDAMASIVTDCVKLRVPETGGRRVIVFETPSLLDVMYLHGLRVELGVSEGGRVEIRNKPGSVFSPEGTRLGEVLSSLNTGLIVYDSLSAPLKSLFVGTQDLPARSSSIALLVGAIQRIASRFDVSVLAINHATLHPHAQGYKLPYGGLIMGYDFKFIFHIDSNVKQARHRAINPELGDHANRAIWVYRHPTIGEYGVAVLARLGDRGLE